MSTSIDAASSTPSGPNEDRYALAENHLSAGELSKAETVLVEALDRTPRAAQSAYLLGVTLAAQGRMDEAKAVIDRAYQLKPWVREPSGEVLDIRQVAGEALSLDPEWDWARYQVERTAYFSVGLTVGYLTRSQLSAGEVFVVQVGANDGRSGDPIMQAIVDYGWKGILVEPLAEPFAKLQALHADRPGLIVENLAISHEDGPTEIFVDPSGRSTLASMRPEQNVLRNKRETLEPVTIEATTFETLFGRHEVTKVDFLQIDTEGFDYQVLKHFELGRWKPLALNMEFYCLPLHERLATFALLRELGYMWKFTGMDLLAVDLTRIDPRFCVHERRSVTA